MTFHNKRSSDNAVMLGCFGGLEYVDPLNIVSALSLDHRVSQTGGRAGRPVSESRAEKWRNASRPMDLFVDGMTCRDCKQSINCIVTVNISDMGDLI